jgi:hypothetical protein
MVELTDEYLADILRAVNAPCERLLPGKWQCGTCETCRRRAAKSIDSIPVVIAALTSPREEIGRLRKALGLKDGDRLIEGHDGEYLAETCSGQRYRVNMLHAEMEELQRLRSEIEHLRDHPEFDCTDAAHPAWWRGQDHAVRVMCQLVTDLLDGKEVAGVCNEPWETVRNRIAALVKQAASPQN